jgi:hypothetical protein
MHLKQIKESGPVKQRIFLDKEGSPEKKRPEPQVKP